MEYTNDEAKASKRYSQILSRTKNNQHSSLNWKRDDFIKWFINKEKRCCYCKSEEAEIQKFHESRPSNKRKEKRGKSLEIERLHSNEYSESNCDLVCFWCNNAKSDTFTSEEFRPIATEIGKIIKLSVQIL